MRARRALIFLAFVAVSVYAVAAPGAGNASGAPASAATAGCTCHGAASALAQLVLEAPAVYQPGTTYELVVRIQATQGVLPPGALNQGGFSLHASAGVLQPIDGTSQSQSPEQVTHTAAGNDQRQWRVRWIAPENATGPVRFSYAANAVNGNGFSDPADHWARATRDVPLDGPLDGGGNATDDPTPTPTTAAGGTPTWAGAAFLATVVALVLLRRRA
jgi:hypothetical protein